MEELEPGASEGVLELVVVLHEPLRDLGVLRVGLEGHVGDQEDRRLGLTLVVGVRDEVFVLEIDRHHAVDTGRARGDFPLVLEQQAEEVVAPLERRGGPDGVEAAGDRVVAHAAAVLVLPAEALILDGSAFGLGADVGVGGGTVAAAHAVTAGDESHGLLVVHRHAGEGLADVVCGERRVGHAVGTTREHIDEAHEHGAERRLELALTGVALVGEPFDFLAPVDVLLGTPDVLAAAAEAEGLETHLLVGNVAGEHQQVGPADLLAVLLLDRPQHAAGLVEVAVVGPAVEGSEALGAGARTAATVGHPVGAGSVPREAHHQAAVVTPVGRPPVLRVVDGGGDVGLEAVIVDAVELGGVVEVLVHRVRLAVVLMEDLQVELLGPPLLGGRGAHRRVRTRERALACI